MKIKETYGKISEIKNLSSFNAFRGRHGFKFALDEMPSSIPRSPEYALLARQVALYVDHGWINYKLKAQWQNYWLSCCISPKCDYIFAVLKECGIDREKDIMDLWGKGILWEYLGSEHGKSYYQDTCMKFLLRRYAWWKASQLWYKYNRKSFSVINLILPRLIGTILLGFIPLVMADEIWQFPSKMYAESITDYWSLFGLLLGVSWIYLLIECRNTVGKIKIFRPSLVFFGGVIISLFLSFCIVVPLLSPYISTADVSCKHTKLLFASAALLIGIFIQVFWEEKTITEPL